MDDFLERYHLPKLNKDQVNYLNSPITPKEIKTVIKISQQQKKSQGLDGFSADFYQTFKEQLQILLKLFHEIPTQKEHYLIHSMRP